jgi:uncharacterized protein (UPF0335 family)
MEKLESETVIEYLERIEKEFNYYSGNIESTLQEMKEKGIKICRNCGCSVYKDKEHKCEE